ncbi:hypothetical protein EYF80_009923 [Liparis tanakae]|uniref:Uncharacterized protein n=1 Tax=Liparis tanakae TaxID=230148 RepID=A0A4Z2IPU0_9TELE|nr:hypothetical protein EYF80_009923 [Liparis tanakae]
MLRRSTNTFFSQFIILVKHFFSTWPAWATSPAPHRIIAPQSTNGSHLRNPRISSTGLKPQRPWKRVRAMAISGLEDFEEEGQLTLEGVFDLGAQAGGEVGDPLAQRGLSVLHHSDRVSADHQLGHLAVQPHLTPRIMLHGTGQGKH